MSTRFSAPLPALAGVKTRQLQIQPWWSALAPKFADRTAALSADWMTFTVRERGDEIEETLTAQQLKGDVALEVAARRLTIATTVADVANGRPHKGLAKLLDRGRSHRALAGASVPTSAISRIELDLDYPTTAPDADGRAHIAERGHGPLRSARLRVVFLVATYVCEAIVDFQHPGPDDDATLLYVLDHLVEERFGSRQPLLIDEHPATAPKNWTQTLRIDLPDAVPVPLDGAVHITAAAEDDASGVRPAERGASRPGRRYPR